MPEPLGLADVCLRLLAALGPCALERGLGIRGKRRYGRSGDEDGADGGP